ncbi:MAG: HgcAB-like fusion protein, partial [Promethearchaeota archaeon]
LFTQTSTKPVRNLEGKVREAGFEIQKIENYQADSFQLIYAKKPKEQIELTSSLKFDNLPRPPGGIGSTIWQTIMRMSGHSTEIGLIPVGEPDSNSPVLCTCNFNLTVRRLYNLLKKKKINGWILVAPTGGINVWCASCGGNFNAGSVITAIKISSLEKYVNHRQIILPQLGASGIDIKRIKKITGWQCVWGPVQMEDIPQFLANLPKSIHNKTEKQRSIQFNTKFRLEMGSAMVGFFLLILGIPLFLIFYFLDIWIWTLPILVSIIFYIYFIFLFWPIIPSHWGTRKVIFGSIFILVLISIGSWFVTEYLQIHDIQASSYHGFYAILNWWPLDIAILITMLIFIYDADGLTPNLRSSLLAQSWNKGKFNVIERWGSSYSPTPYGRITVDLEKCTGCGICVDVCPMLIPKLNKEKKKVALKKPEFCVNCRGCVNQCPTEA